ncbi:hypothetical protein D9M68_48270 [compost metagenome]|uniref:Uncharacterized protein n=2 Tax=Pseudomonas TaxID=286 RepID=A0A1H4LVD5_PSEJE|nr:hypothetical protein SAMN04490187_1806 [Pseudomonas jessenii]VVQ07189.1 hypothetical protein PS922_04286 [Pseudomonas fluorescens]
MLAKNLRALRGVRLPALSLTTIASALAPTGTCVFSEGTKKPAEAGFSFLQNQAFCRLSR